MAGYKVKKGSLWRKGSQTHPIKRTLMMNDSDDIMTQNLGEPIKNTVGAQ